MFRTNRARIIVILLAVLVLKNCDLCFGTRKSILKKPKAIVNLFDTTTEINNVTVKTQRGTKQYNFYTKEKEKKDVKLKNIYFDETYTTEINNITAKAQTATRKHRFHSKRKEKQHTAEKNIYIDDADILPKKKKDKLFYPQYGEPIELDEDKDYINLDDIRMENRKILTQKYPPIVKITNENKIELCTGTVIDPKWVLTTKNCVIKNIRFLIYDPKCNCSWMKASKYLYPKKFGRINDKNTLLLFNIKKKLNTFETSLEHVNIALMKLENPWPDSRNLAKLPDGPITLDLADVFPSCYMLGYEKIINKEGKKFKFSHRMIETKTNLLPIRRYCSLPNKCGAKFDVRSKVFSLYYPGGKKCIEDEGYPLFCSSANKPMVVYGIAGRKKSYCGYARIGYQGFTRIDTYVGWIYSMLNGIN